MNTSSLIRGADLLEREAQILHDAHTHEGDWCGDKAARHQHAELIEAATDLRATASEIEANNAKLERWLQSPGVINIDSDADRQRFLAEVESRQQLMVENERLREELKTRAHQIGIACTEHDLTHALACGRCHADALAENERLHADSVQTLANHACKYLPTGWVLQLSMEQDAAWVSLYDQDCNEIEIPGATDKALVDQVRESVSEAARLTAEAREGA